MRRLEKKPLIHLFDPDGRSVASRQQLERENAILKDQNEMLLRQIKSLRLRSSGIDLFDLQLPTRH